MLKLKSLGRLKFITIQIVWFSSETFPEHCIIVISIVFQDLIYTEFDRLSFTRNRPKTADSISGKHYFIPSIPGSTAGEV